MVAAREGKEDAVAALLDCGADPMLKSGEGLTAADMAERADKPYIAAAIAAHQNWWRFAMNSHLC